MPPDRLYLAPLRGLTDGVFRTVFSRHFSGFDLAVAPFISTVSTPRVKPTLLKDIRPERNRAMPVVPQLLSNDPEGFIRMARRIADLGYGEINLNLGCPFPMVAKKGRGSGMLPFPDRVAAFLDRVAPAIPCALSVKTRLGFHAADEIFRLMPVFNRYPLSELIVHPRTGVRMYGGRPDLETFSACLAESALPVVYNGDIRSPAAFHCLKDRFPAVRGWMIGRGALADPFLAEHLKAGSEKIPPDLTRFRVFQEDLFRSYDEILSGPAHTVDRMKGFWYYFSQSFPENRRDIKKIPRSRSPEGYHDAVSAFFAADPVWRPAESDPPTGGCFEDTDR